MQAIHWWNGLGRQRRLGWFLIAAAVFYIVYFLKARLLVGGDPIKTKEWVWLVVSCVGIMIGTINIRMADMRDRNQQPLPLVDPKKVRK